MEFGLRRFEKGKGNVGGGNVGEGLGLGKGEEGCGGIVNEGKIK